MSGYRSAAVAAFALLLLCGCTQQTTAPTASLQSAVTATAPASVTPTPTPSPAETTAAPAQAKRAPAPIAALHHPKAGSAERKAILDALRVPVEKELGQAVVFKVSTFSAMGSWAFLYGRPLQPSGKAVDYTHTPYIEAIAGGAFDDGVSALLKLEGGRWRVVTYNIGATDVAWYDWDKRYGAPKAIFPH
jgi:hypothetical protein